MYLKRSVLVKDGDQFLILPSMFTFSWLQVLFEVIYYLQNTDFCIQTHLTQINGSCYILNMLYATLTRLSVPLLFWSLVPTT